MTGWCSSEKEKNPSRKFQGVEGLPNKEQCGLMDKTKQILTAKDISNTV